VSSVHSGLAGGVPWSALPELPPELRALFACAETVLVPSRVSDLPPLLERCPSADRLCDAAIHHGMLGNLHKLAVLDSIVYVDPALKTRLSETQRAAILRALRQTRELLRILDLLEAGGVEAMPFKGPAWAQSLYGDIAMRTWSDLDLLVSHADVSTARVSLLNQGFVDANAFNSEIAKRGKGSLGQIALRHEEANVHLELHWAITVGISARSLSPGSMFSGAGDLELLGKTVMFPSKTDQLLITCMEGTRDRWNKVEKLLGLGVLIERLSPEDWYEVLAAARAAGCLRRVCVGVAHVCRVLGIETIPRVAEVMRSDWLGRYCEASLKLSRFSSCTAVGSREDLEQLIWNLSTEDRLVASVGHGLRRLFQPGPGDWASYSLPKGLRWLYGPLRPVRLALKWSRRLLLGNLEVRRETSGRNQGSV